MKKFKGAITAIVTPFLENGELDLESLELLVEFQIKNGIFGLVPCGSTGEAATLSDEEKDLVIKTVVKKARKRVPVIAGAGSNDTVKAVKLSQIAEKAGADALLHVTPFYNKPTPKGLIAHFKAIAEACDLPIILYNVPGRTGQNVSAETTLKVAKEVPSVIGVKEASGNILQMADIIQGASKNFCVLSGEDSLTFPFMALGGDGVISVVSNEIPKEISKMTRLALEGNWEKARKLHYEWLDLMNANFFETNPQPVKTALAMMGKIQEVFRLPLVPMEEKNKEKLREVLTSHKLV
ncbi:MAG: 4-hydroxy-tetrahydrodipicolinate synthase [Candidatus Daviesbacteria bacterium]|nr:4-hydroxy-tetrahydrodipicolinate synthase [Candidatus Daviesbacteria bacterium]